MKRLLRVTLFSGLVLTLAGTVWAFAWPLLRVREIEQSGAEIGARLGLVEAAATPGFYLAAAGMVFVTTSFIVWARHESHHGPEREAARRGRRGGE